MLKYMPVPLVPPLGGQRGGELSDNEYYSYPASESPADAADEEGRPRSPPNAPKGGAENFPSTPPAYSLLDLPSGIQEKVHSFLKAQELATLSCLRHQEGSVEIWVSTFFTTGRIPGLRRSFGRAGGEVGGPVVEAAGQICGWGWDGAVRWGGGARTG